MVKERVNFRLSLEEKIIKYLLENKTERISILKVAHDLNVDYKNVYQAIARLGPELIKKEKIGNTNLIKFSFNFNEKVYLVEQKRREEILEMNKELKLALEDIKSINYPFFIVLLFGSVVKKTNNLKSDVDICIISENKAKAKELNSKLAIFPLHLDIQEFTPEEFESMLKKKEDSVVQEIVKNNVILYGAENYYNLVSKWMKKE